MVAKLIRILFDLRVSFDYFSRDHADLILFNWDQSNLNRLFLICPLNLALMPQNRQLKTPFLEFGLKKSLLFYFKAVFFQSVLNRNRGR